MTWLRLDDGFDEHPKVKALTAGAFRAHIRAMCWSARQETDGRLTRRVAIDLATKRQRIELVQAGLWDELSDGEYAIHDYLEYNPSRAKLKAKRDATRKRVNAHRNAVTDSVGNDVGNTSPGPARPVPILPPDGGSDAREARPPADPPASSSDLETRTVERPRQAGEAPRPRHDPLAERISWPNWYPSTSHLAWWRELGLDDKAVDSLLAAVAEHHGRIRKSVGRWDEVVESYSLTQVEIERSKAEPPGLKAHQSRTGKRNAGTSPDWPDAGAMSLRERALAGEWGKRFAEEVKAGRHDVSTARRRIAEIDQLRAERQAHGQAQ